MTRRAASFFALTVSLILCFTVIPMVAFAWPMSNLYNALVYHIGPTSSAYDNTVEFPYGAASAFNVFSLVNYFTHEGVQLPWVFCYLWIGACVGVYTLFWKSQVKKFDFTLTVKWSLLVLLVFFTTRPWVSEQNLIFLFTFFTLSYLLARAFQVELKLQDFGNIRLMWAMLFSFVVVHVPAIAFFWLPFPQSLGIATSFCDGSFGWTRLLSMTLLAVGWLAVSWDHIIKTLKVDYESIDITSKPTATSRPPEPNYEHIDLTPKPTKTSQPLILNHESVDLTPKPTETSQHPKPPAHHRTRKRRTSQARSKPREKSGSKSKRKNFGGKR